MAKDKRTRQLILETCSNEPLFFINSFVWTYDPRETTTCLPMITYQRQDELILKCKESIEKSMTTRHDQSLVVAKSRSVGASWCIMELFDWYCRFYPGELSFLAISRKEEYVDDPQDPDSLFAKIDFLEARLPAWMKVEMTRTKLKIIYAGTRSKITGESSNADAGRAGRATAVMRDEEAFSENGVRISMALKHNTRCQLRVSTPNGVGNTFYEAVQRAKTRKFFFHWSQHDVMRTGLYSVKGGAVQVLDSAWHKANPGYQFRTSTTYADPGTEWEWLRSPWFDAQEDASESPLELAQEVQMSFQNSGAPFFRVDVIADLKGKQLRQPFLAGAVGDVMGPWLKRQLVDRDQRPDRARLWANLAAGHVPPQETTYTMGIDISAGTGASDSAISIGDDRTREKVFEFVTNGMLPDDLAYLAVDVARWFSTPYGACLMAWDAGAHGMPFGARVELLTYPMVFTMQCTDGRRKARNKPGVHFDRKLKTMMFEAYRAKLTDGGYITHSENEYAQIVQFEYDGNGGVTHNAARTTSDRSDVGDQHGDVVTSGVILVAAQTNRRVDNAPRQTVEYGSQEHRFRQREAEERSQAVWVA